jgi:hypothetical protein
MDGMVTEKLTAFRPSACFLTLSRSAWVPTKPATCRPLPSRSTVMLPHSTPEICGTGGGAGGLGGGAFVFVFACLFDDPFYVWYSLGCSAVALFARLTRPTPTRW